MATPPPPAAAAAAGVLPLHPPRFPQISPVKLESPTSAPPPSTSTPTIPSCSRWFSLTSIHPTEIRLLPDFFSPSTPTPSRSPAAYKYYRDTIVRLARSTPSPITFTDVRRRVVGDVGSVRRVFDFLETWGLINYQSKVGAVVRREGDEVGERKERGVVARTCGSCKTACSLACFVTEKADFVLCTRCYVRGNYRPGLSSSDFKRVDIIEETKTEWTDKETLHLLEAVFQYGEDWKKVSEHVGSRSEKECVARFIKLPFGEQFLRWEEGRADSREVQKNDQVINENGETNVEETLSSKRRRLTPLADASNPIMAQVAFLTAMVGSEVVEAASEAAIAALQEIDPGRGSRANEAVEETSPRNNQNDVGSLQAVAVAQSHHEKEQQDVEQTVSDIVDVQMKVIQEKIVHFEDVELQLEKDRLQLSYMKDLLFADQLSILQHKAQLKLLTYKEADTFRPNSIT